jgi:RsiW-degrading membrane proteinase PrsW (M82 family)
MNLTSESTSIIYGIIAGMLPSLLWLWFWLKEDNLHDEPKKTLAACFFFGMAIVFIALPLEWLDTSLTSNINYQYIWIAVIEESLKLSVALIAAFWVKKLYEPVDAMIYLITVALGFAAMENTLFLLGIHSSVNSTILTSDLRFVGATLLHVIASGSIGFMLAMTYYHGKFMKFLAGIVGLALAVTLHAAFDLAIINSNPADTLKVYAWVWAGVIILIVLFEEAKGVEQRHISLKKSPAKSSTE